MRRITLFAFLALAAAALQGCASTGGGGDPGANSLPAGQSCQSIRNELNKLDARGVPAQVERVTAGKSVNAAQKADVDKYNTLLSQYLGSRCHV